MLLSLSLLSRTHIPDPADGSLEDNRSRENLGVGSISFSTSSFFPESATFFSPHIIMNRVGPFSKVQSPQAYLRLRVLTLHVVFTPGLGVTAAASRESQWLRLGRLVFKCVASVHFKGQRAKPLT